MTTEAIKASADAASEAAASASTPEDSGESAAIGDSQSPVKSLFGEEMPSIEELTGEVEEKKASDDTVDAKKVEDEKKAEADKKAADDKATEEKKAEADKKAEEKKTDGKHA